jgi:hypothetical protein
MYIVGFFIIPLWLNKGGAVGLVDTLTCLTVWLPTYSEEQAFYERL